MITSERLSDVTNLFFFTIFFFFQAEDGIRDIGVTGVQTCALPISDISTARRTSRLRRHNRLRKRVGGTPERPRLVVKRSARHIHVQLVDDTVGRTLATASTMALRDAEGDKPALARQVGALIADRATSAGLTAVVFDRGGNRYAGRIAALAAGDREGGVRMPGPRARGGAAGGGNHRRDGRDGGRGPGGAPAEKSNYIERVVAINRVSKVVKGGRRFSFTALVIVGDGEGKVGVGYGKAKEVPAAIAKGVEEAKKHFYNVPRIASTIPHPVQGEAAAGVVLLKPASPGTGVIAGGPVRAVLECAGIHDVLSKSLGSSNPINIVHATMQALKELVRPEEIAARRGLPLEDVAPAAMLRARAGQGV